MGGWVDLHNHVIPGVDDGARDGDDAQQAVAALRADGVAVVVATPHVDGSLTARPAELAERLAEVDRGWVRLRAALGAEAPDLRRGVELKLDAPEVDLSDSRLRLGGGRAALVEFPHMTIPPRSAHALAAIRREGYVPLLAHPERYEGLDPDLSVVASWLDAGAYLQVNAASLRGRYGPVARTVAEELLARGWVHCLASDYHSYGEPRLAAVREVLESWGAREQARALFEENPMRLLMDEPCLPVEAVHRPRSLRGRLRALLPW